MRFQTINTPEQLMAYLDQNFEYGVIDNSGNRVYGSNSCKFQTICNTQWRLRTVEEMLKDRVGHCYDQVEIEREWFTSNGFEVKTFWISAYLQGVENSGFCHAYLVFKDNDNWKLFEHADGFNKGIYTFKGINDAVNWQAEKQIKFAQAHGTPSQQYSVCIKEFATPPKRVNMQEYLQFIATSKDYIQ